MKPGHGALLLAALVLAGGPAAAAGERHSTLAGLRALHEALDGYRAEAGELPASPAALGTVASVRAPDVVVERGQAVDGWGRPYVYRRSEAGDDPGYEIYSTGPNGADEGGGGDDVAAAATGRATALTGPALRIFPFLLLGVAGPVIWALLRALRRALD